MKKKIFLNLAIIFYIIAVLSWFSASQFLGFTVISLFLAIIFSFLYGLKNLKKVFLNLYKMEFKFYLKSFFLIGITLLFLLAFVFFFKLPFVDFSSNKDFTLEIETKILLSKLEEPLKIEINLSSNNLNNFRLKELLNAFESENNLLQYQIINADAKIEFDTEIRLAESNSAKLKYKNKEEAINIINEKELYEAINRIINNENFLVYFLTTIGEKSLADTSELGLSDLKITFERQNIFAKDYLFLEDRALNLLPKFMVIANPMLPLGETREKIILNYLENGGRLMILVDPLVTNFSNEFWAALGLKKFEGLVLDPELNIGNTGDAYVLANDFPHHEITENLKRPVLFPVVGAFGLANKDVEEAKKAENYLENVAYILALSSSLSWLETDLTEISNNKMSFTKGKDLEGPLALAIALEIKNENQGRLILVADSDFLTNNSLKHLGNDRFIKSCFNWLLSEDILFLSFDNTNLKNLKLSNTSARLTFWLPVLVWPTLILLIWFIYYKRRKNN